MYRGIVSHALRRMGVGMQYKGRFCVVLAVGLYLENQGRHLRITKEVYPVIGKKMQLNWKTVEQNITYVVRKCWKNNRAYLQELAGYVLDRPPTNQEFFDILVNYVLRAGKRLES